MRIAFWHPVQGGSPLVVGLDRGLRELGHTVEYFSHGRPYDLVIMFNMSAHVTGYEYQAMPQDGIPFAFVDTAEYGWTKRLPTVVRQYANAFAPGSMKHDTKNEHEQKRLKRFFEGRSFPYFLREYSKCVNYPPAYRPVDYPLYKLSECHERPDREEYLKRQRSLFVSWGASHPFRIPISMALRESPHQVDVRIVEENGTPRMPQDENFWRTRQARTSISYDGYGFGSFRVTEVLVRTILLMGPIPAVTHAPLTDGETCIEYAVNSDGDKFLETNVADKLKEAIDDPERSFRIYEAGYHHCHEKYSERATATYVLDSIMEHDWSQPTPLDL